MEKLMLEEGWETGSQLNSLYKDMFFFAGTNFHFKIRFLPLKWANLGVE